MRSIIQMALILLLFPTADALAQKKPVTDDVQRKAMKKPWNDKGRRIIVGAPFCNDRYVTFNANFKEVPTRITVPMDSVEMVRYPWAKDTAIGVIVAGGRHYYVSGETYSIVVVNCLYGLGRSN